MTILAGDIGGTKTVLTLIDRVHGVRQPLASARFVSRDHDSLTDVVTAFLSDKQHFLQQSPLRAAAFGVAGPVENGRSHITNLSWVIDQNDLAEHLGLPAEKIRILNDLEATATAVPHLQKEDLHTINPGVPVPNAPLAIIAPGTGLGEAFLVWTHGQYQAFPSEGGHADFAPSNQLQLQLLNYLSLQYGHVSLERVCSGLGIPNIYRFLREEKRLEEPVHLTEALMRASDPVPIIMTNALDAQDSIPLTRQTLEIFVSILAAEAGNMALKLLAQGGVYIGGGIPPRILPAIDSDQFRAALVDKGRFTTMMSEIPVHVILNDQCALLGAAYAALTLE
ncbi:MAG: glucokinase [Ardenticatenaceae bacterium]|nr:glucokinase [Ardenticatenaceae bacterium]